MLGQISLLFLLFLSKTAVMLLRLFETLLKLLHDVLQVLIFVAMHDL